MIVKEPVMVKKEDGTEELMLEVSDFGNRLEPGKPPKSVTLEPIRVVGEKDYPVEG